MDGNLQLIRNDLWILTRRILADAVDEDDGKKLHIGEVLGVLAAAIEEDNIQSLAITITGWAKESLASRQVEVPSSPC
jgi:hypothetical protein